MILKIATLIITASILVIISHINFEPFENIRTFNLITESFTSFFVAILFCVSHHLTKDQSFFKNYFAIGCYFAFIALTVDTLDQLYYHPPFYTGLMEKSLKIIGYSFIVLGVRSWIQNYKELNQSLIKQVHQDNLTGLYNRRGVQKELEIFHNKSKEENKTYSLIVIDIDNFKVINDSFGHLVGDEVLRRVGAYFLSLRSEHQKVGRWGGEEFAMVIYDTNGSEASEICEKVREDIEKIDMSDILGDHAVTMSFGVSELKGDNNYLEVMKRSDRALYRSKKAGKNCVTIV